MIFTNYLKTSVRNFRRQKMFSFISLSSLTIGLAIFLFFLQIFIFSDSFDSFHKNAERIFTIVEVFPGGSQGDRNAAFTPVQLPIALKSEIPEIEDVTRSYRSSRMTLRYKSNIFFENGGLFTDPNFLSFFTFNIISGDKDKLLAQPNSIILTKSFAVKYFGDEEPLGKSINLNNKIDLTVTGIMEDVPKNSTIDFDFLVSFETARLAYDLKDDWNIHNVSSFIRLPVGYGTKQLENKFSGFIKKHYPRVDNSPSRIYLLPLLEIHFRPSYIIAGFSRDDKSGNYFSLILGVLFLILACINYMNLATARYTDRLKEVGIRKSIGANRFSLIKRFLGESIFFTIISFPLALMIYEVLRPGVSTLFQNYIDLSLWNNPKTFIYLFGILVLVGILSGSYPALFLSSFKPVQILKGKFQSGKKGGTLRKILVVVQFSVSIVFIFLAIALNNQSDYTFNANLGYNRNGVIAVTLPQEAKRNLDIYKDEVRKISNVIAVSSSSSLPGYWPRESQIVPQGATEQTAIAMATYAVDYDFAKVMNIEINIGRDFSKEYDDGNNFIISELAYKRLGWEDPIGKVLKFDNKEGKIIGVVKNFHFKDVYDPMSPTLLYLEKEKLNYILIKVSGEDHIQSITEQLKAIWKNLSPDLPFNSITLKEHYHQLFLTRENIVIFISFTTLIAIFFSALGLFGLVSYTVKRQTKEIGIRKILGSNVSELVLLLGKKFIRLIILANIIGIPIGYYGAQSLLNLYTFRAELDTNVYFIAIFLTLLTAIISIAWQVLRASRANPVESLKYE